MLTVKYGRLLGLNRGAIEELIRIGSKSKELAA